MSAPFNGLKKLLSLRRNNLTEGSTFSNVIYLAIPLVIGATMHTTQSLIDMFWVGRLGSVALAAVAMGYTVIMVVVPLIFGIATGTISLVSQNIGAKRQIDADNVATQSIIIALISSFILAVVGYIFAPDFLKALGAADEVILAGTGYLRILFLGSVTLFVMFLGSATLQGTGDVIVPTIVMILANVLNIILDPILIFGIGVPAMGVTGAALATVISQGVSCVIILYILFKGHSHVHIRLKEFYLKPKIAWDILRIGIPSSLQLFFRTIMRVVLMGIVSAFGTYAVAAYGIGMRLQMVMLMPAFALGTSAATLVGQNLGAGKVDKAKKSALTATGIDLGIMLTTGILFFIFAPQIVSIFDKTPEVIAIGTNYFRITALFYSFIAFGIVLNRALGGAGDTVVPMIITFVSLWIILVPLAIFLSRYTSLGLNGVWYAMAVSTVVNGLLILFWFLTGNWKKGRLKKQPNL
ncbi:MAG: MATE family efflux transporter [Candidatus Omnitrophota bacterium]